MLIGVDLRRPVVEQPTVDYDGVQGGGKSRFTARSRRQAADRGRSSSIGSCYGAPTRTRAGSPPRPLRIKPARMRI